MKAELAKRIESKLMGFHAISLLKMMLNKPANEEDPRNHNDGGFLEPSEKANEART